MEYIRTHDVLLVNEEDFAEGSQTTSVRLCPFSVLVIATGPTTDLDKKGDPIKRGVWEVRTRISTPLVPTCQALHYSSTIA